MKKITRRIVLGGILSSSSAATYAARRGGAPPSTPPVPPASQLSTLTLVNTSGSTQAADFVSPMFGWVFKKGDIPSGTVPAFKISSVAQPYSWGLQSYWSDGSLKFASFMLRSTASIAGNGSLAIGVWSGGIAPTTSARTLTEVYNESLKVNVTGYGASLGLAGSWSAWLDAAANTNNNNVEQLVYLDGDAGKVWRILTHMSATKTGAAHGQLECWHYVAALTNAAGTLGGFRYLPCIAQPWYDVDSPAKAIRSFTTVNWQHGAGPTTVPLALGLTAIDFSTVGGTANATTKVAGVPTVSDFYAGMLGNSTGWHIPCYLTTTGTLPGGLSLNTLYYCHADTNGTTVYFTLSSSSGGSGITLSSTGTGTHTINPIATLNHFGRLFMPTTEAKWNYFQGAGSLATEATVRAKIDQTYWHGDGTNKLSLIVPWDLALAGITDDPTFTYNWTPYGVGPLTGDRAAGGGTSSRSDLGAMMGFQGIDFLQQSANSEKVVRIIAYPGVHDLHCVRNSGNFNVVNMRGVSHTGMSNNSTFRWYPDTNSDASSSGFTKPPDLNVGQIFDQFTNEHKPQFFHWAYLRTGEPQFLDLMIEMGIGGPMEIPSARRNSTAPNPGNYTGTAGLFGGGGNTREMAWGNRDLQWAASVVPAVMPDGSGVPACLVGMADDTISALNAIAASAAIMGSYAVTNHLQMPWDPSGSALFNCQGFHHQYLQYSMCIAAAARESAPAKTWLDNEALWHAYVVSKFGYYCTTGYFNHTQLNTDDSLNGTPAIPSDAMFGTSCPFDISYNGAATLHWTFTPSYPTNGAVLADGDKFLFNAANSAGLPANYLIDTAYYAINTSGNSCKLTTVAGNAGSIVVPTGSGTPTNPNYNWYVPVTDVAAAVGAENTGYSGSGSYMSWKRAAHLWMTALGVGGLGASITDAGLRSGCTGTDPLFKADTRNAYQDHFGA